MKKIRDYDSEYFFTDISRDEKRRHPVFESVEEYRKFNETFTMEEYNEKVEELKASSKSPSMDAAAYFRQRMLDRNWKMLQNAQITDKAIFVCYDVQFPDRIRVNCIGAFASEKVAKEFVKNSDFREDINIYLKDENGKTVFDFGKDLDEGRDL